MMAYKTHMEAMTLTYGRADLAKKMMLKMIHDHIEREIQADGFEMQPLEAFFLQTLAFSRLLKSLDPSFSLRFSFL